MDFEAPGRSLGQHNNELIFYHSFVRDHAENSKTEREKTNQTGFLHPNNYFPFRRLPLNQSATGPSALPTSPDPPHPKLSIRRSRLSRRPGNKLMDTRCLARSIREQTGSGTGTMPCGRTGPDGIPGCCSGCRRCSCSGSQNAGSPVCCSRSRHESHATCSPHHRIPATPIHPSAHPCSPQDRKSVV